MPPHRFTQLPNIQPYILAYDEIDDQHEQLTNFYCDNCFGTNIILLKRESDKPFEQRCFRCLDCENYNFCGVLLEQLPSNAEIERQKAMRRKALDDEIEELEDEMEDLIHVRSKI